MTMRYAAVLTLAAALTLSACGRGPAETLPEDNVVEVEDVIEAENAVVAPPPVNATNIAAPVAPAPGFTDDEQMRDDADATGMTARLPDDSLPAGNDTAPVK